MRRGNARSLLFSSIISTQPMLAPVMLLIGGEDSVEEQREFAQTV